MKIALVLMPWVEVHMSSLAMASLKSSLEAEGFSVDCHYFNLLMYSRVGPLARALSFNMTWTEWLFGHHLFGRAGSGELQETLEEIYRKGTDRDSLASTGLPLETFRKLVHDDIPRFLEDCLSQTRWDQYGLIGFSSIFGSHAACLKLSRELKSRHPGIPIVFGGANLEGEMGLATLEGCDWIDYVVDGEGEEALLRLARNLEQGKPYERVPRVSFRRGREIVKSRASGAGAVDLDHLPVPDHADFFAAQERYGIARTTNLSLTFEASRGCWYGEKQHCTFCSFNGEAMAFRAKPVENVVRDIMTLLRRHRVNRFYATDNILGMDHLRRLMPELARIRREQGLDWQLFFEIKANLTEEHVATLAEAGVATIQAGIESLSTPVLRAMRKGVSAIQNIQTLKLGAKHGVEVLWNILWGFHGETARDYERTADDVLALTHLQPPDGFTRARIERFSPHYFDWEKFAARRPAPHDAYRFVYPADRFRIEKIAYQFEPADEPADEAKESALARLSEAVAFWKRTWSKNFLAYRQGLDYVDVIDSRPLKIGGSAQLRQESLEGPEAAVFSSCAAIKGFGQILDACRRSDPGCSERRVKKALDSLVGRRWIFQEDRKYLNLALPVSRLPLRQKFLFDQMETLRRQMLERGEVQRPECAA